MIDWNYIVISACVLLLVFLLRNELVRKNKARLIWRLLATIGSMVTLVCMALPITYHRLANVSANHEAVLLTAGFEKDSVRRFLKENKDVSVFSLDKDLKDADKYNAVYLADVNDLIAQHKEVNTLHVFGYGLQNNELKTLQTAPIVFHPANIATGITQINWKQTIKAGEKLVISGSLNDGSNAAVKVVLSSFHTTIDSVNISSAKSRNFQLNAIPKQIGRAVYSLAVIDKKDTIEKELIPVQVTIGQRLKVLMLQSSPDFENKFLKNWLAQKGYLVVAKATISKNRFVKDFLNTEALPLDKITSSLLDKFDVTIADAVSLSSLPASESAAVKNQVTERGMGLIVTADSAIAHKSVYANSFYAAPGTNEQVQLHLLDSATKFPDLNIESPLFIRDRTDAQNLVFDAKSRVVANSTLQGLGKVVITTVTNTFSWSLAANKSDYERFWSTLLNNCLPKAIEKETWAITPVLPQLNNEVQIQVQTNAVAKPQAQVGEAAVYLAQNSLLPYLFTGTFYPTKEGWQTAIQLDGKPFYWYVYSKNDWKSLRAQEKIRATKQFALANQPVAKRVAEKIETTKTEVSKMIFFVLFLLFSGFLWLENKF